MGNEKLLTKLKYKAPLLIKDFKTLWEAGKPINPKSMLSLSLNNLSYQQNYEIFRDNVLNSIGNKYFPIYRMADGEFIFCVRNLDNNNQYFIKYYTIMQSLKQIYVNIKRLIIGQKMYGRKMPSYFREKLFNVFNPQYFYVAHGESYTQKEIQNLRKKYINDLKKIANNGYLAIHFIKNIDETDYSEFYESICDFFDKNKVILTEFNYTSFYYVYILLSGCDRKKLYQGKNVLIITSASEEKKIKVSENLYNEGVKTIQFYNISSNKSMFERIDIKQIYQPIDLVLIAAGIGSSNILVQLEPLKTVCIDAGFIIECLANPELREKTRIFLNPDDD